MGVGRAAALQSPSLVPCTHASRPAGRCLAASRGPAVDETRIIPASLAAQRSWLSTAIERLDSRREPAGGESDGEDREGQEDDGEDDANQTTLVAQT